MSQKAVHFKDVGQAMKNLSEGKPALSDGEEYERSYDVEDVRESASDSTETQPMVRNGGTPTVTKYMTIRPTEELTRNSSEPIQSRRKNIWFAILAISGFIGLLVTLIVTDKMNDGPEDELWMKKDIYNEGEDKSLDISASMIHRHNFHTRILRCSDYEFGCCHIYYGCDISDQEELVSDAMTLSPYSIVQHDEHGSNCPRLFDLISEYNEYYPVKEEDHCVDSEFGCCEVNYSCDIRRRFEYLNTVEKTKELWRLDHEKNQTSQSLPVTKLDAIGSNCPRIRTIVYGYEHNWPVEISKLWYVGIIAFVGIICCMKKV
jgi:hypothetical protein